MLGRKVLEKDIVAGQDGGLGTVPQTITLNESAFGKKLSSGVYFYLFIYENEVMARGKMAVVP